MKFKNTGYSATAVGLNSCVRSIVAAITTIFSAQAVDSLGTGVLFTILGCINLLNAGFVILCYVRGTKWRIAFEEKHMPELYAKSMETTITPQVQNEKLDIHSSEKQQDQVLSKSNNIANNDRIERVATHHSTCYSIA